MFMGEGTNLSANPLLCGPLCTLCGSLCNKKKELARRSTEFHREKFKILIKFQNCQECLLRNFHISYLSHSLFPFFLFFQKFPFSCYITSIALCRHIFSYSLNCFAGNNFSSNSCLYCNIELLTGYQLFQLNAHLTSKLICMSSVNKR